MEKKHTIYTYLKTRYSVEEARDALYRAASNAADENWALMDTIFQLGDKAKEDGLSGEDIDKIIRRAYSRERRVRDRRPEDDASEESTSRGTLDLDAESRRLLESRRINPDALMIPWPADDWRKDLIKLLEVAFQPNDMVDFKIAGTPQASRETVANILGQGENISKIMKSLDGVEGALIGINATSQENAKDESWRFRYAVVDSPRMSLSKQLAFYKALNLPCVALVNSGANTVQAWVRIEAADSAEYNDRVDFLYTTLEENGFKVDTSLKSPNLMVRMPGVLRQGKQQYLIGLNEGAKSWKEWQEWVDYCLDGNPLVELASYHKQAPSPDPILIDGVCKACDFLVLQAPPKSGKSLAFIDLALAISQGGEWLGFHTAETDVLYVNFDQSKASFLNRVHLVASERKMDAATPRLGLLHLRGSHLTITEMADFLVRRIEGARKYEEHEYRAVILDPVQALLHSATTNTPGQELNRLADLISSHTGAAVIMAASAYEVQQLQLKPDGIIDLSPTEDRPDIFQIRGAFKDFPPLPGKECTWQYPRFIA